MNIPKRQKASFAASSDEIMTPYHEPHSSFIRNRLRGDYHPVNMATLKDDYHPAYGSNDFHPEMMGEPISLAVARIHNRQKYHQLVQ